MFELAELMYRLPASHAAGGQPAPAVRGWSKARAFAEVDIANNQQGAWLNAAREAGPPVPEPALFGHYYSNSNDESAKPKERVSAP
jgi:hypothetical protein